jgi:hypothetical protein
MTLPCEGCGRRHRVECLSACCSPTRSPARWRVLCPACRARSRAWYGIEAARLLDPRSRAFLDRHVRSRRWYPATTGWPRVLRVLGRRARP